ncbi:hypothetical protein AYJ57_15810 [Salipiger sp. CCB-MM3]|uniref:site-specific integrase n=1 Tax=Salipiger sp. CCB-MM3 TaxID=1792508 RepID=UPI00080ABC0A|nr:site-specific integrase [Salipiger sp. CCB-MM3]ANT61922.1 hypothetical protein AYJ57_15810 [Salipiger sp. CCB-MM3]
MKHFSADDLSLALLPHQTPMFSDVVAKIEADTNLSPTRKRDMASALKRVAEALGKTPSNMPADPRWLQPRLEAITPAMIGVSQKTWANLVSNARAALVHSGIAKVRTNQQHALTESWRVLWETARTSGKIHDSLSRFVYFLDRLGVAPEEVGDPHVTAYHDALMDDEIRKNPAASLRNAVNAWNRAVEYVPEWPKTRLKGTEPKAQKIKLPLASFPASFSADLACFKKTAGRADFLAEPGIRPLAPASIATYARLLERFAGAVVRSGIPAEDIPDIAALLSDQMLEAGLRWLYARNGDALTPGLKLTILALQQVGRRHLGRTEQPLIDKYVKRLPKKQQGMTEQNRARLRPMLAPQMTARIAKLPEVLMKRAGTQTSHKACLLREQAIALEILLHCPIRRGNLLSIDLDRHLQRPGDGRVYLVFPQDEVKNRMMLEFELPKRIVEMIDGHIALRSPRLCPAGTTYLFPKRDGSHPMAGEHLSDNFKKCLRRELGLEVNLHLFRHFAAHILLEACPGHYEAARRLLGHSRLTSTLNAYTGVETTSAARTYADIVGKLQQ